MFPVEESLFFLDRGYGLNKLYIFKIIEAVLPSLQSTQNRRFSLADDIESLFKKAKAFLSENTQKKSEKDELKILQVDLASLEQQLQQQTKVLIWNLFYVDSPHVDCLDKLFFWLSPNICSTQQTDPSSQPNSSDQQTDPSSQPISSDQQTNVTSQPTNPLSSQTNLSAGVLSNVGGLDFVSHLQASSQEPNFFLSQSNNNNQIDNDDDSDEKKDSNNQQASNKKKK